MPNSTYSKKNTWIARCDEVICVKNSKHLKSNIHLGIYKIYPYWLITNIPHFPRTLGGAQLICSGCVQRPPMKQEGWSKQIFKSGIRNLFIWGDPSSNYHDHDHPHQMAGGAGCRAASERCDEAGRWRKGNNPSGARRYHPWINCSELGLNLLVT